MFHSVPSFSYQDTADFIEQALLGGGKVAVNCFAGMLLSMYLDYDLRYAGRCLTLLYHSCVLPDAQEGDECGGGHGHGQEEQGCPP